MSLLQQKSTSESCMQEKARTTRAPHQSNVSRKAEIMKAIFNKEIKESPKLDVPISIKNKDFSIEL